MVKKMTAGLAACALGAAVGFAAWQLPAAFSRQASAACAAVAEQTAAAGLCIPLLRRGQKAGRQVQVAPSASFYFAFFTAMIGNIEPVPIALSFAKV